MHSGSTAGKLHLIWLGVLKEALISTTSAEGLPVHFETSGTSTSAAEAAVLCRTFRRHKCLFHPRMETIWANAAKSLLRASAVILIPATGHFDSDGEGFTLSNRRFQTRGAFNTKPVDLPAASIVNCIE